MVHIFPYNSVIPFSVYASTDVIPPLLPPPSILSMRSSTPQHTVSPSIFVIRLRTRTLLSLFLSLFRLLLARKTDVCSRTSGKENDARACAIYARNSEEAIRERVSQKFPPANLSARRQKAIRYFAELRSRAPGGKEN